MIFITGDVHGEYDLRKFGKDEFPVQSELTKKDYVIICGDFGFLWDESKTEKYWLKWLDRKPWTTLWIDGNHENYTLLSRYLIEDWNGGKIQKITDSIYHLCRGSIFTIEGRKIFAFGGAESHDKQFRTPGISYWPQEMPSLKELITGAENLNRNDWKTDIVVSHSLPTFILKELGMTEIYQPNTLTDYFEKLNRKMDFDLWFSGHYHRNLQCTHRHYMIFDSIAQITDDGFSIVSGEEM
ncbi:MAG: metallophosphoesterase [Oscillospiraceae bacterium]|nr:metallophosphoesterase [Oscillospiraceae bacterium]